MSGGWVWVIKRGGAGCFLDPPGSPQHGLHVEGWWHDKGPDSARRRMMAKRQDPDVWTSLKGALEDPDVSGSIKGSVKRAFAEAELRMTEGWLSNVYGYFKNCYSPDGEDRNVSDFVRTGPPEWHLAHLLVKEWFPDATPRLDLIESGGGYGTRTCMKCGVRVQYEAKFDAWAEFDKGPRCSAGDNHDVGTDEPVHSVNGEGGR